MYYVHQYLQPITKSDVLLFPRLSLLHLILASILTKDFSLNTPTPGTPGMLLHLKAVLQAHKHYFTYGPYASVGQIMQSMLRSIILSNHKVYYIIIDAGANFVIIENV